MFSISSFYQKIYAKEQDGDFKRITTVNIFFIPLWNIYEIYVIYVRELLHYSYIRQIFEKKM